VATGFHTGERRVKVFAPETALGRPPQARLFPTNGGGEKYGKPFILKGFRRFPRSVRLFLQMLPQRTA
jgi:hypothetical protein